MGYRGVTQADDGWARAVGQKQLMTNLKLETHVHAYTHFFPGFRDVCKSSQLSISRVFPALQSFFDSLSPPIHTAKHILVGEELILHNCHSVPVWLIPCFLTLRKDKGFPVAS